MADEKPADPPPPPPPPADPPPAVPPPADSAPEPAPADTAGGDSAPPTPIRDEHHYQPIFIITACFGALFIILPFLVRKGPNKGLIRCCIMLSLFCMWIFWVTIYIGHMNPLLGPRMRNTTIAWMAYKLGNPAKPASINQTEADL